MRGTRGDATVRLAGPQAQVAKVVQADIHPMPDLAQADLTRNDVQNVALRVPLADTQIVASTDPTTVAVRIEKLVSRTLPVQVRFANDAPRGFQPSAPTFSSTEIKITGAQSLVASVAAVFATLRFGPPPTDIAPAAAAVGLAAPGHPVERAHAGTPPLRSNL